MFTGIVEGVASIVRLDPVGGRVELELELDPELCRGVAIGDSIALDGCCLTVTASSERRLSFQAVPETLRRTSLGDKRPGDRLNVERALRADARLGGHIVQGHVDGTGIVAELRHQGEDVCLRIRADRELLRLLVPKGSIAIDGVSLTVVDAEPEELSVVLIPHTLALTTLGERRAGDKVNLEVDVLGKYVHRYLEQLGLPGTDR